SIGAIGDQGVSHLAIARRFQSADQVDADLRQIMADIHARIAREARGGNHIDYRRGANVAGYRKVADALVAYGTN
ncbi:MAG: NADP-specific glutamate dehydrogenase, partial [Pseudomonadota bacterium]